MVLNLLLIIIALAAFAYLIYILGRRLRHIANINVAATSEHKQIQMRRRILEEKLRNDLKKRWKIVRELVNVERISSAQKLVKTGYQKLRDLEHELRTMRSHDLSTQMTKTQSVDEMLATARQATAEKKLEKAEQVLLEALKVDEHNIKVFTLLAQVYRERGDYDHAKETLEFLLQLTNHEDASVYQSLANIARERGDLHTAQSEYLQSISLDPNNHHYLLELAEVYKILEDLVKAQDAAQRALALAPSNPKILDFLVENSIVLQDKNQATAYLSKLREANPQNGKIKSFEQRIEQL